MAAGNSPEWLNQNSTRAYPLAENSSRIDLTGSVRIPDSLLVAAQINAGQEYAVGTFFISAILATPDVVTLKISYLGATGTSREISKVGVFVALHTDNTNYSFVGQGTDGSILGSLTIGNLFDTLNLLPGLVEFSADSTPFETNALFFSTPAFKELQLYNGNTFVESFNRILKLRQGSNIRLTYVGEDTIRIDAIAGENLVTPASCDNALPKPPCIRTINGIGPDVTGNFQIEGSTCIDVSPSGNGVIVTDLCSKSCCGCSELEVLVNSLQQLETQIESLRNQANSVNEQQSTMIANLVANLI